MRIRRYYRRGSKPKYTISEEYYKILVRKYGVDRASVIDNANYAIILESDEEEKSWYFDCLSRVLSNPRWYLDNIEFLPTFKVNIKKIFPKISR